MLFTVLGSLSAAFLIWVYDFLQKKDPPWKKPFLALALALLLVFLGWGGGWRNSDAINDSTILVTKAELPVLDWIKSHTPKMPVSLSIRPIGAMESIAALTPVAGSCPRQGDGAWRPTTFIPTALIRRHGKPGLTGQHALLA